jgi:hypothetical protein
MKLSLVVALHLVMLPPAPILLSTPPCASSLAGCCIVSTQPAVSDLPASLPLIAPSPLIVPWPPVPNSTVTTNCHTVHIVHSHLPLLPLSFFSALLPLLLLLSWYFFSLFLATHATKRSLLPDEQCPHLQRLSRLKTGGLPLPPGGSATNDAMSIPTAPTCFRSWGGHLNN